jgi:hypothetical protein
MARNLFVLSGTKDSKVPVTVELIPPKGLEQTLKTSASATPRETTIKFFDAKSNLDNQNMPVFEALGEYDKIAAFIDIPSDDQFFTLLQLIQRGELLVRWDQAHIVYLLRTSDVYIDQCATTFRPQLLEARNEEMSYQDVYIRCNKLWSR